MNIWHSSFGAEKKLWLSDPVSVVCHKVTTSDLHFVSCVVEAHGTLYNFTQLTCIKSIFVLKCQYFNITSL